MWTSRIAAILMKGAPHAGLLADVQRQIGQHPRRPGFPRRQAGLSKPCRNVGAGPSACLAEEAEEQIEQGADLPDVPSGVLPHWLPDRHDASWPERPSDAPHQL